MLDETVAARISEDARIEVDALFATATQRLARRRDASGDQHKVNEALVRLMPEADLREVLRDRGVPKAADVFDQVSTAAAGARQRITQISVEDEPVSLEDSQLQFLVPPYADTWRSTNTSGDAYADTAVNVAGDFGFTLVTGDGAAAAGAAVWAQFIPDGPLPRVVQIRPYVRFEYQYDDNTTGKPYTAHNDGDFGIHVLSWNLQGHDRRVEYPFPWTYSQWSVGTGWFSEDSNPSWPDSDSGHAYMFLPGGSTIPYFQAQPGRVYRAAVWCFGSCDAGGGFFGNAISAGWIGAQVPFVVLGER